MFNLMEKCFLTKLKQYKTKKYIVPKEIKCVKNMSVFRNVSTIPHKASTRARPRGEPLSTWQGPTPEAPGLCLCGIYHK